MSPSAALNCIVDECLTVDQKSRLHLGSSHYIYLVLPHDHALRQVPELFQRLVSNKNAAG